MTAVSHPRDYFVGRRPMRGSPRSVIANAVHAASLSHLGICRPIFSAPRRRKLSVAHRPYLYVFGGLRPCRTGAPSVLFASLRLAIYFSLAVKPKGEMQLISMANKIRVHHDPGPPLTGRPFMLQSARLHFTSKRSRFITFTQAATKASTNACLASFSANASACARNCELEPNKRSTRVAVHLTSPVLRSRAS